MTGRHEAVSFIAVDMECSLSDSVLLCFIVRTMWGDSETGIPKKKEILGSLLYHTHGLVPKYGAGNRFFPFFPGHFPRRIPRQESFIIIKFSISYNRFTTFHSP